MPNRTRPKGNYVLVKLDITGGNAPTNDEAGGRTPRTGNDVYIRVKEGTANIFGWTIVEELPLGLNNRGYIFGSKNGRSFTCVFGTAKTSRGEPVKSVKVPMPPTVSVAEFVKYAKASMTEVDQIITPHGRVINLKINEVTETVRETVAP